MTNTKDEILLRIASLVQLHKLGIWPGEVTIPEALAEEIYNLYWKRIEKDS